MFFTTHPYPIRDMRLLYKVLDIVNIINKKDEFYGNTRKKI